MLRLINLQCRPIMHHAILYSPAAQGLPNISWHAAQAPAHKPEAGTLQVFLADGSTFFLDAKKVLIQAAEKVAIQGISPAQHLEHQIIPAVKLEPGLLLTITRQMAWQDVLAMAHGQSWRTPIAVTGPSLWRTAQVSMARSPSLH
ncbi:hypothetical protein [Novimethylophilus kurashikiensis]|uniref:hypothetical protein n=1 Tax=Novimethylophilus kurashikiensis TaxID=1825523 RepID=UPI0011B25534|nr:hypothetical protein [Novimethylophilus kurashikiensis]